jgi:hypothetical protein
MTISSSIDVLRDWMRQNDVHLDPRLMLVEYNSGVGVIALDDLSSVGSSGMSPSLCHYTYAEIKSNCLTQWHLFQNLLYFRCESVAYIPW